MAVHLERDIGQLKSEILNLGSKVEKSINNAIKALVNRRPELADEVVENDEKIDEQEVSIEEDCLKILALHQPVARDLRFIVTVLKVNRQLERMGDQAVNIALKAKFLAQKDPIDTPVDLSKMVTQVQDMVSQSLEALVNQDPEQARNVSEMDAIVNDSYQTMFENFKDSMTEDPDTIERSIHTLLISRHLERLGDLATNICNDVIFLVEADVVRHQLPEAVEVDYD